MKKMKDTIWVCTLSKNVATSDSNSEESHFNLLAF